MYTAVDLCSGAGGVTTGLRRLGVRVLGAVDNDLDCVRTMRTNHRNTKTLQIDLTRASPVTLMREFGLRRGELDILAACTPCQVFSSMAGKNSKPRDYRALLVSRMADFVKSWLPRAVIMENVPGLRHHWRFKRLLGMLRSLGYAVSHKVLCASDVGVPQRRKRLVCVAIRSRGSLPDLELSGDSGSQRRSTVREAFRASKLCAHDPLNRARRMSGIVMQRIQAIPKDGGSRASLCRRLELRCHSKIRARGTAGATNVYGRMKWDEPAPTLTTRCTTPACGRFLHPTQNRPITLREAALLQTFPSTYKFVGSYGSIERQIGNAVPPYLATATAKFVIGLLEGRVGGDVSEE